MWHEHLNALTKYLATGVLNTLICALIIALAEDWLNTSPYAANAFGYTIAFCLSFAINRRWTFSARGYWALQGLRWTVISAGAYLLNLILLFIMLRLFSWRAVYAQGVAMAGYTISAYVGHHTYTFARPS